MHFAPPDPLPDDIGVKLCAQGVCAAGTSAAVAALDEQVKNWRENSVSTFGDGLDRRMTALT